MRASSATSQPKRIRRSEYTDSKWGVRDGDVRMTRGRFMSGARARARAWRAAPTTGSAGCARCATLTCGSCCASCATSTASTARWTACVTHPPPNRRTRYEPPWPPTATHKHCYALYVYIILYINFSFVFSLNGLTFFIEVGNLHMSQFWSQFKI